MKHLIALPEGLVLFLCGMHLMSANLEELAGERMRAMMEKLAAGPLRGVCLGTGLTAVLQSSTAISVMAVGLVNSELLSLEQSTWILMGANVGTTLTGQLMALDMRVFSCACAFLGMLLLLFFKKRSLRHLGGSLAGFGVLFIGLEQMEKAVLPLGEVPGFVGLLTNFRNPLWGILAGTLVTALLQSSTVSLGILQALAGSGLIGFDHSVYLVFGQNIGACVTAMLASIGTNVNARRTALIHLLINLIGTVLFLILCLWTPLIPLMARTASGNISMQIANVHTIFNVASTIILLPLGVRLADLSRRMITDKKISGNLQKYQL